MTVVGMHRSAGRLEAALRAGHFVLTAETSPPDAGTAAPVLERAGCLKGLADAVNVTDGAGARARMSALAAAAILAQHGIEPVLQFTVRDRNRIALQGDLLGAAALGVPNILCLHGDDVKKGDQPEAKPVYDIDSRELMRTARRLRDDGTLPSGRAVEPRPGLFIGAADQAADPRPGWKPEALLAKIEAGADFVQTQYAFDLALLRRYMAALADHAIPDRRHRRRRPAGLGQGSALDERAPVRRACAGGADRAARQGAGRARRRPPHLRRAAAGAGGNQRRGRRSLDVAPA